MEGYGANEPPPPIYPFSLPSANDYQQYVGLLPRQNENGVRLNPKGDISRAFFSCNHLDGRLTTGMRWGGGGGCIVEICLPVEITCPSVFYIYLSIYILIGQPFCRLDRESHYAVGVSVSFLGSRSND